MFLPTSNFDFSSLSRLRKATPDAFEVAVVREFGKLHVVDGAQFSAWLEKSSDGYGSDAQLVAADVIRVLVSVW